MVDLRFLESNSLGDETEELPTVTSQYKEKKTDPANSSWTSSLLGAGALK